MAFVKLDTGILNSTLWVERDCREVFITALLMAEPIELMNPMPQIEVRQMKETGFVVPPGWYGFIRAAGIGIVRQSLVGIEEGLDALIKLGQPDYESRSAAYDGRRLVRVDGGYIILNFIKYRERDTTTADRSRRWRERKKQSATEQRVSDTPTRVIRHQAEAEAEERSREENSPAAAGGSVLRASPDDPGTEPAPAQDADPGDQLPGDEITENPNETGHQPPDSPEQPSDFGLATDHPRRANANIDPPTIPDFLNRSRALEDAAYALWSTMAQEVGWPDSGFLSSAQRPFLAERLRECGGIDGWKTALAKLREAKWLREDNDLPKWFINLKWLVDPNNFNGLMEDRYAKQHRPNGATEERSLTAALAGLAEGSSG